MHSSFGRPGHNRGTSLLTLIAAGAGLVIAGAGLARVLAQRRRDDTETDAPHWTLKRRSDRAVFGKAVLVNRPRQDVFDAWKVERFPEFMENVVAVETLGNDRSKWIIKAPLGREVTLVSRITKTDPGRAIYWQSEDGSDIDNSGMIRFEDAPGNRGTYVSLVLAYNPPAGAVGRATAKLLQREPEVQARRDLHRFKQLLETGEVTTNASPSARKSEDPTKPHI
ncbi:SRPBCC family protein [Altererythrobacter sp. KTW20L]|uniref:SRPBCC family protein n=1 Tax=Altererythrobacter sp. KTW20L TaxID=2942210 RepID=UPI0020C16B27|nr:SRPBCC family protein [Altererythrobacter sp. KTW20L]MCL6250803.1 SRPBCC family protein [Altererythrobacter sp. KTW20L]